MIERQRRVYIAAVLCLASGPGLGTARADDVQVNTYTPGDQRRPSVALDADGDFVVVWSSEGSGGTDTSFYSIQGQRYAADGSTVGGQFQVNTYTTSLQRQPSVALDAGGDFVVVWASQGSGGADSSGYSVQGQRYAADGSAAGSQFQINTHTPSGQLHPSVAANGDGDFVVAWQSYTSGGTDSSYTSVHGQRYAADGSAVGGEFQVNTYTTNHQQDVSLAIDDAGDFVVVWSGTDPSGAIIQGQRYAANGSAAGAEFQVNTHPIGFPGHPSVAMDVDGDFVVVWFSYGSGGTDSSGNSIQGQRYAADGSTAGGQFQVNTYTTTGQLLPAVAMDADGDFIVVWHGFGSGGTDTSGSSIQGQRYAANGSPVGGELQVNTYTSSIQSRACVSIDDAGDFVIVWESLGSGGTDTDGTSVQKTGAGFVPVELTYFAVE